VRTKGNRSKQWLPSARKGAQNLNLIRDLNGWRVGKMVDKTNFSKIQDEMATNTETGVAGLKLDCREIRVRKRVTVKFAHRGWKANGSQAVTTGECPWANIPEFRTRFEGNTLKAARALLRFLEPSCLGKTGFPN
jgi:hypothetical protein